MMRLDARELVDLSRRTRVLARTKRQTWWLMTSVSTEAQPPPRRPQFTSSTMRSSWPPATKCLPAGGVTDRYATTVAGARRRPG